MIEALTHPRWADTLGAPVELYRGSVELNWDAEMVSGEGQAWLGWLPSPRVFLSWGFDHRSGWDIADRADRIQVTLSEVGGGGLVHLGGSPDPPEAAAPADPYPVTMSGSVDQFVVGDNVAVDEARFMVINGPELLGERLVDDHGGFWAARTTLETPRWRFVLDQRRDMSRVKGDLKWTYPFGFTHVGQVVRCDGAVITVDETAEALGLLGYFLSFVRGASVAAVLPCGLDSAGATVWEDWGSVNRTVHPWRTTISWFDMTLTKHLSQLFTGFAERWDDPDDQQVLRYALAFYGGGNDPRPLQTGLTLSVSGLELMAWVYLVRDGTMDPDDFDDQGVRARTLKHLLETVGIDTDRIPDRLPELRRDGRLGHDAIWQLRSRFTHPRIERIATDYDMLAEAWRLASWYLELVLLHWFAYTGPYGSRLMAGRWQGDVEHLPWASAESA